MIRNARDRQVGRGERASPDLEPRGLDPTLSVKERDEPLPKERGRLLVTWDAQTPAPVIHLGEESTLTRLHFLIVDYLNGLGLVVAGWLADPLGWVARATVDAPGEGEFDIFAEAVCLADRRQNERFDAPREAAIKFGFVLLVPERFLGTAVGLQLALHLLAGERRDYTVPLVGDIISLHEILVAAPSHSVYDLIARLLTTWRTNNPRAQRLPEQLEALAASIHQRIDPQRDYGLQSGLPLATCHVDSAIRVGTAGILAAGWLVPEHGDEIKEVALVSLFGRRVIVSTPLPAKARPDVAASRGGELADINCGYALFAPIEGLDRLDALWFLEVVSQFGGISRTPFICPPEPLPFRGIEATVMLAEVKDPDISDLFERAVSPAVEWFWSRTRGPGLHSAETVYGEAPVSAQVSIIVPVYGRIDFIRHQIARFSNDPEFRAAAGIVDLIYVLDDPTKAEAFTRLCRFSFDVYGVPFRTLVQSQNRGYSAANNAGAAIAKGSLLLLLNSDVFPVEPRWVGRLATQYQGLDRCGILGCRLLFEAGSIQHAGMNFRASVMVAGCWGNDHPGKGLSVSFDTHIEPTPVPAVTGACLMIGRVLFDKIGGMSEEYVIGDFEDSDLCLRVQENGLVVYYTPEVELYHLERQSMQFIGGGHVGWRQSLALYNMWKHSRRWSAVIRKVLERFGSDVASDAVNAKHGTVDTNSLDPSSYRVKPILQDPEALMYRRQRQGSSPPRGKRGRHGKE